MSAGSFCRSASSVTTISPRGAAEAGVERRRLAGVAPLAEDPHRGVRRRERAQHFEAAVGRAVVDEDQLVASGRASRASGAISCGEERDILLLVVERNDDREAYQLFHGARPPFQSSFRCR